MSIAAIRKRLDALQGLADRRAERIAAIPAWVRNPPSRLIVTGAVVPRWVRDVSPISYSEIIDRDGGFIPDMETSELGEIYETLKGLVR